MATTRERSCHFFIRSTNAMTKTQNPRLLYTAVNDFLLERETLSDAELVRAYEKEVWELSFIVSGFGIISAADRSSVFSSGDVVLVAPHASCRWNFSPVTYSAEDSRAERLCLNVNDAFLRNLCSTNPYLTNVRAVCDNPVPLVKFDAPVAQRLSQVMRSMETESRALQVVDVLRLVTIGAENNETHKVPQTEATTTDDVTAIGKACKFIKMNAWRGITLDEVSRHMSMSKSAFCAFFKKGTGSSFVSYLDSYRIDTACIMLMRDPTRSVSDVCFETGFNSVSYFNRVFKKYKGVSPSVYRHGTSFLP